MISQPEQNTFKFLNRNNMSEYCKKTVILSYDSIQLIYALLEGNKEYYCEDDKELSLYEQALFEIKSALFS